ncbi:TonB-dependent siderophore receptor [Pseudoalteromonas sp. CO302Y]|uniref:TonB-dependent siderophore receptor n=1 Tax=unclassified Pseudoalteromonas TaxID=194690 RepID=UPI0010236BDA|nr:TonB-dependent siderophore receptor [Pseudoalteromonas sp. CO302Y]RZG05973.1 TonB-dependent siderophore receptor [Pseudoalteromonas sp. CO133X]
MSFSLLKNVSYILTIYVLPSQAIFANATDNIDSEKIEVITVNAYEPAKEISAATKSNIPLLETPQAVAVIERIELDARGVDNLNEAARYTSGVLPESQGIDNRVDDLYIRGFDAGSFGNNVMIDGMRAPSNGSNSWNRAAINSWNLERVEILKGPSGALYGQIAPGGMVNQVSKLPTLNQEQIFKLQFNATGRYQGAFDLGGSNQNEDSIWRVVGLYSNGDTQVDHTEHTQWFLAPSNQFEFNNGKTKLTLLGIYQQDNGGSTFQFYPYHGSIIPGANGYIDNTTLLGEPNWNTYDRTIWSIGWLLDHEITPNWRLEQSARVTDVESLYKVTVGFGVRGQSVENVNTLINGRILKRRAVQGDGASKAVTVDTRLSGSIRMGAVKHNVLFGADYQKTDWNFYRQMARVAPEEIQIDIYDPEYTYFDFENVLFDQMNTAEIDKQFGFYLQDQIHYKKWRLTLGARYDGFSIDSTNLLNNTHSEIKDNSFTARTGLTYVFDSGFVPFISYSESFQPATGTDRNGQNFDPTKGKQWEMGMKYEPKSFSGMISASIFDLRQENILTSDPLNESHETYMVQSGEVKVKGLELEGRITPFNGLSVIGATTYFDSSITENNDGNKGNQMIRVPNWMASLWLDYTLLEGKADGLSIALGGRYIGQTYGDIANSLDIPSYALIDAALRYDLGWINDYRVQFSLNASNLQDKRYVASCTALTACYYGSGRKLTASVTINW